MIDERNELYGAASPSELAAETYENYKRFVNPPLARVMKISGSPVEVRASGSTIWDQNGKAYLDFAGGYGVFTLGHRHPRVLEAVRAQLDLMALSGKTMFNVMLGRASRRLAELAPGDLADLVLVQQRHRGDRRRDQARARGDRAREDRRHRSTRFTARRSARSR